MPPRHRRILAASDGANVAVAQDSPPTWQDAFYSSGDGLKLFARIYGDAVSHWIPVVCLPGLTRSSRDFHPLAMHLSGHRHRPRRVVAFDYRGRGNSERDPDGSGYNPLTEMNDVLTGMAALGVSRAVVVGTSRGGIVGMLMGVARPAVLAGLVLNDVGPVIEARGLARIKAYVGRTPQPDDWPDAAHIQRRLHGGQFTAWGDEDWDAFARLTYRDEGGMPAGDYDPALAGTLDGIDLDRPIPTMWDEFGALGAIPILSIRGENSDLLSADTVKRMAAAHPHIDAITVAGEGHPPLLRQAQVLNRISAFITSIEDAGPPTTATIPREPATFDLDEQSA